MTPSAARRALIQRAQRDNFTGAVANGTWGAGKLDLIASTAAVGDEASGVFLFGGAVQSFQKALHPAASLPPNDGGGDFFPSTSAPVRFPYVENVEGFTILPPQGEHRPSIAVISASGARIVELGANRNWQEGFFTAPTGLTGTDIAAGDFDGDGVIDLAAVDGTQLVIARGKPALP